MTETSLPPMVGVPSPTLKVICAGFGRTGTGSLNRALKQLGVFPVATPSENIAHPERYALWLEALRQKRTGEAIDWRPLLTGYRATKDFPSVYFWRELVAAHPEAKVILTVRDPERWYESVRSTLYANYQKRTASRVGRFLSGVVKWLDPHSALRFRIFYETLWDGTFGGRFGQREHAIRVFEEHIREVKATVPPDRLLVFEVNQGWEPLCRFLGVPVPIGQPFPQVNSTLDFRRKVTRHFKRFTRGLLPALAAAGAGGMAGFLGSRSWQFHHRITTMPRAGTAAQAGRMHNTE